jgi:hypothetical protein
MVQRQPQTTIKRQLRWLGDSNSVGSKMTKMARQQQCNKTINNKKRGSGSRSIGGRREATQWRTNDNNNGGEGGRNRGDALVADDMIHNNQQ